MQTLRLGLSLTDLSVQRPMVLAIALPLKVPAVHAEKLASAFGQAASRRGAKHWLGWNSTNTTEATSKMSAFRPQGAPGLIRLGLAPAPVLGSYAPERQMLLRNGPGRLRMRRPLTPLSLTHPKEIGQRYYSGRSRSALTPHVRCPH
jgi:hypothetical protein